MRVGYRSIAIAAACLPAIFAFPAMASEVAITVTGSVLLGTDTSGVFGFAPRTDLAGKPYTLTFTFDDSLGTGSFSSDQSYIKNTSTSNPGTAVLQIGSGSFAFGTTQYSPLATSEAYKRVIGASSYYLEANDGNYGGEWNDIQGTVYPATGTLLATDPSWEAPFYNSNLYVAPLPQDRYSFGFGIVEESDNLIANGDLTADTITVSGPAASSAPEPMSLWLVAGGLIVGILYRSYTTKGSQTALRDHLRRQQSREE